MTQVLVDFAVFLLYNIIIHEWEANGSPNLLEGSMTKSKKIVDDILIRKYQHGIDNVKEMGAIAFNNALLGEPFDRICDCRDWFGDAVLSPYIKHQPENAYVAIHQPTDRIIGYLTGSLGGEEFGKLQYKMVRDRVAFLGMKAAMPWNVFDHSTRAFTFYLAVQGEKERADNPGTGAHWHFQVDKDFRGCGIGTKMYELFVEEARSAGFETIWAEVMAYKEKPREYFEELGWDVYNSKPTTIFKSCIDDPVDIMCITRSL